MVSLWFPRQPFICRLHCFTYSVTLYICSSFLFSDFIFSLSQNNMAKYYKFSTQGNRKSSRVKGKGKISSPTLLILTSPTKIFLKPLPFIHFGKNPFILDETECSENKVIFDFNSSLNIKTDFLETHK